MTYRTVHRRNRLERELPALRLLSVITAVWFLAAGWADVLMGFQLLAVLDFFLASLFLFFRLRMNAMPLSAVRGFVPPILLFLNLLPLGRQPWLPEGPVPLQVTWSAPGFVRRQTLTRGSTSGADTDQEQPA